MDLPEAWTSPLTSFLNQGFKVNQAFLVIDHTITNNPNDQIRPEDYENEAAIGRLPSYTIDDNGTPDDPTDDIWYSLRDSFTGDGTYIPAGTVFKDPSLIIPGGASSDLAEGFTNEWYTSTDRDPFEWSYDQNSNPLIQDFVGFSSPEEAEANGFTMDQLVSGPRWRLGSNKFGQDLPGVEIPLIPNSEPPFTRDNIKYEVGEATTTVLNLLDWEDGDSPFLYSPGWIEADPDRVNENGVTENGLTLTEKFDVAIYFKGDRKAADIYDARLEIDYQDIDPVFDVVWRNPSTGEAEAWFVEAGEQVGSAPLLPQVADANWRIGAIGDIDNDGDRDDLFWRNFGTGDTGTWYTDLTENGVEGMTFTTLAQVSPSSAWAVGGIGDVDQDGFEDDVLWFESDSNWVGVWYFDEGQPSYDILDMQSPVGSGWEMVGVGSFDGQDNVDDIMWRNALTGANAVSIMNGSTFIQHIVIEPEANLSWQIAGISDFDSDGIADDVLWRNTDLASTRLWFMENLMLMDTINDFQPAQPADLMVVA